MAARWRNWLYTVYRRIDWHWMLIVIISRISMSIIARKNCRIEWSAQFEYINAVSKVVRFLFYFVLLTELVYCGRKICSDCTPLGKRCFTRWAAEKWFAQLTWPRCVLSASAQRTKDQTWNVRARLIVLSASAYHHEIRNGATPWSTLHGPRFSLIEQKMKKQNAREELFVEKQSPRKRNRMGSVRSAPQLREERNDLWELRTRSIAQYVKRP